MSQIIVHGGKRLDGEIVIKGAKNAALPIISASILTDEPVVIHNCPKIIDVFYMIEILRAVGCKASWEDNNLFIECKEANNHIMPPNLSKKIRSSIFMLGSMVGRFHRAVFTFPGGCEIGARPIDLHLKALRQLGIEIEEDQGMISCQCGRMQGSAIHLDYPSVGATENIMLAAVKAKGTTVITNAAREPEIVDLENFVNQMGGKISGAGSSTIVIEGVEELHGCEYSCIPDRIIAGTYMVGAAVTRGELLLKGVQYEHVSAFSDILSRAGAEIVSVDNGLKIKVRDQLKELDIVETAPYPGFPTDMQPQMCIAACFAKGTSVIIENVFESRFRHIGELMKMGGNIKVKSNMAIIKGVPKLVGCDVAAYDLRGGAALCLAGLGAQGDTVIHNADVIYRGYEDIVKDLQSVGAQIVRIEEQ